MTPMMLTVEDVAQLTAISPKTLYHLVAEGKFLAPVRLGKRMRWPRVVFEKWMADGAPMPSVRQRRRVMA